MRLVERGRSSRLRPTRSHHTLFAQSTMSASPAAGGASAAGIRAPVTAAPTGTAAPTASAAHTGTPAAVGPTTPPAAQEEVAASSDYAAPNTGNEKTNARLEANFVSTQRLRVGQIQRTEYTRQINQLGLKNVKESYKTKGWVEGNAPYVLVPREQLPSGRDTVFSAALLSSLKVFCLDGNHRVQALLDLEGADFEIACRLYLHFDCDETVNSLARSEFK